MGSFGWRSYDKDKDGRLSKKEFARAAVEMKAKASSKFQKKILSMTNEDKPQNIPGHGPEPPRDVSDHSVFAEIKADTHSMTEAGNHQDPDDPGSAGQDDPADSATPSESSGADEDAITKAEQNSEEA